MSQAPLGAVIWIIGPPASGKTTLAQTILASLGRAGLSTLWLDSDDLREYITPGASYSPADRDLFYRALAHLAELGERGGSHVVISATASRHSYRQQLRERVSRFVEIHLHAPIDTLKNRDPKGLYAQAEAGKITSLPGVGAPFEHPEGADLSVDTSQSNPEATAKLALALLEKKLGSKLTA